MPTWLILDEAARCFNIGLDHLEALVNVGSLLLRRAARSQLVDGVRQILVEDLERIVAEPNRSESGVFTDFGDGLENPRGEWFRTVKWAQDGNLKLRFSRQSLIRYRHERTPLLGNMEFEGYLAPVYVGNGKWKEVWVFKQTQLAKLSEILAVKRAVDPLRGPGVSYRECKNEFGLSRSSLDDWHASGIPELENQKLSRWYEWRPVERKRSGRSSILVAKAFVVFSPNQIEDALEAQRKRAIAAQGHKTELTDREAMARFAGIFRDGDLYRWRQHCEFIGRALVARRLPDGTWLNRLKDLETIADKLLEHERARKTHNKRVERGEKETSIDSKKIAFRGPTAWFLEGQDPKQFVEVPKMPRGWAASVPESVLSVEASNAPDRQPAREQRRRGPRRSAITQEIYTTCYDLLAEGRSRREVLNLLRMKFRDPKYASSLPKEERHVSLYAKRRAENPDDPRLWPIPGRRA